MIFPRIDERSDMSALHTAETFALHAAETSALQSSVPSIGPPLAAFVVLVLVGTVGGAIGSAVVRRLPNPVGKYRLLYLAVLLPGALLSYGVFTLLGFGDAVVGLLPAPPTPPAPLGTAIANVVELLAAGVVWLAAYAPTVRGVRRVRGIDLSTGEALRKMARYVVVLSVVIAVLVTPLQVVPGDATPLVFGAGLVAIAAVFLYGSPWLLPLFRSTRVPEGETADRLSRLCDRAGLTVRDVRILENDAEETANVVVRGPPGHRRLFVTSTFLDAFDDATATALVAIEAGRLREHLLEVRFGAVVAGGLALIASLTGTGPAWPLLGLSLVLVVVGFGAARRRVRAADEIAAERVGASDLADALERYADVHSLEPSRRRFPNPLSVTVALGDRIDRLRDRRRERE